MSVKPAQTTQLPGTEFKYDNNPSGFETLLGGLGSFMNSVKEKQKAESTARNQAMANGFASLFAKGVAGFGKNPDPYGQTETWGGTQFYMKPVIGEDAGDIQSRASAASSLATARSKEFEMTPQGQIFDLTKAMVSSVAGNPGFKMDSLTADPAAIGGFAYSAAKEVMEQMKIDAPTSTSKDLKRKGKSPTSSGGTVGEASGMVTIQGKNSSGKLVTKQVKKSDKNTIKMLLDAGGKIV